jgi:hypothetical protein
MTEKAPEENFDCIAFKRRVQAEIYEEIKDLSPEEEIAYFRRRVETGPFAELWKKLGERRPSPVSK